MLYTEENVRANIRTREGKRVFFLGKGDNLTPGARDFLTRERIEVRSAEEAPMREYQLPCGALLTEKPEHMTHLQGNVLVPKDHPRIAFRGAIDGLQAQILLCQLAVPELRKELGELLELARRIIRADVLEEPLEEGKLWGMTARELRERSHRPQEYYAQPHFMPQWDDGEEILRLNALRCRIRDAERLAVAAYLDGDGRPSRVDIPQALNRMSSAVYILMVRLKKER